MVTSMNEIIQAHYEKNFGRLVKFYTRSTGTKEDAEDVVHDAYECAIRYGSSFDKNKDFSAWFSAALRNSFNKHLNEKRGLSFEELDPHSFQDVEEYLSFEYKNFIEKMLQGESQNVQPILELHFLKGYSAKEIYQFNKFTYPNTRKIIQRFRDKLKAEYGRQAEAVRGDGADSSLTDILERLSGSSSEEYGGVPSLTE